jgi:hypothetical protein
MVNMTENQVTFIAIWTLLAPIGDVPILRGGLIDLRNTCTYGAKVPRRKRDLFRRSFQCGHCLEGSFSLAKANMMRDSLDNVCLRCDELPVVARSDSDDAYDVTEFVLRRRLFLQHVKEFLIDTLGTSEVLQQ